MTKTLATFLLFVLLSLSGYGQFFNRTNWDDHRHIIEFGFGTSNFLGDLGGKDAIGTNDLKDLEKSEFHLGGYLGYKYVLNKKLYLRADLSFARVTGDDKLTAEAFRQNRNLHFRSNIFELAAMVEYEIVINFRKGHIYDIKGVSGWKAGGSSLFLYAGIGAFYFNPKALVEGEWVDLKPLRTEGQGLPGGPKEYNRVSVSLPLGVSISKRMSKTFSLGLDVSYRYTFTDYIDDVSTSYFNPYDISLYNDAATADVAAYLSNPALGVSQGGLGNIVTSPGQQRGDETDDDGYMLITLRGQYLLTEKGFYRGAKKKKFRSKVGRSKRITF
jgi:hypothetical protein